MFCQPVSKAPHCPLHRALEEKYPIRGTISIERYRENRDELRDGSQWYYLKSNGAMANRMELCGPISTILRPEFQRGPPGVTRAGRIQYGQRTIPVRRLTGHAM